MDSNVLFLKNAKTCRVSAWGRLPGKMSWRWVPQACPEGVGTWGRVLGVGASGACLRVGVSGACPEGGYLGRVLRSECLGSMSQVVGTWWWVPPGVWPWGCVLRGGYLGDMS